MNLDAHTDNKWLFTEYMDNCRKTAKKTTIKYGEIQVNTINWPLWLILNDGMKSS